MPAEAEGEHFMLSPIKIRYQPPSDGHRHLLREHSHSFHYFVDDL